MKRYRLTLTDQDGVLLDHWNVTDSTIVREPDDDAHDVSRPFAVSDIIEDVRLGIRHHQDG